MIPSLIILSMAISLILLILKCWTNVIKTKELSIDYTDVIIIASIGIGIPIGFDFIRIFYLSLTTTELQFFKPYSIHLIYTTLIILSVSINSLNKLKIRFK